MESDFKGAHYRRLRKALRIAEEERDILKQATAFFAKQSR
jgi:transposase-like protein